jgi:hypothetical protein
MACEPADPFFYYCIHELGLIDMEGKKGFQATGNRFLTDMIAKRGNLYPFKIYPSAYFIPQHAVDIIRRKEYAGSERVYAKHHWGSTFQTYGTKEMI